jgi:hypothetical protein
MMAQQQGVEAQHKARYKGKTKIMNQKKKRKEKI